MNPQRSLLVFAYGSNMCTARLLERTPGARKVATGFADGHRLAFHKRGRDHSGKATLAPAHPSDSVPGIIFSIPASEMPALDRAEPGYARRSIAIRCADRIRTAVAYFAEPDHIDESLRPFQWYVALVIAGIREHGLPSSHSAAIGRVRATVDPDAARRARHRRLWASDGRA